MREDKRILLVAQKNPADDDPASDAVFEVGTLAQVLQLLKSECDLALALAGCRTPADVTRDLLG